MKGFAATGVDDDWWSRAWQCFFYRFHDLEWRWVDFCAEIDRSSDEKDYGGFGKTHGMRGTVLLRCRAVFREGMREDLRKGQVLYLLESLSRARGPC